MSEAAYTFAIVCEADADRRIACDLADRVLLESERLSWIDNQEMLHSMRDWLRHDGEHFYLAWKTVKDRYEDSIKGKREWKAFGNFSGNKGKPDALTARKALIYLELCMPRPKAVFLIRDSDGYPERKEGLEQARDEPSRRPFEVIIGVAEPCREAWVLAGFVPEEHEASKLSDEQRRLGFCPVERSHLLKPRENKQLKKGQSSTSAKAVHANLLPNPDREAQCWRETPLPLLRERGHGCGLTAYLDELDTRLIPLFAERPS
ncbi:MAG: hypothetical protein RLY93_04670 [Sumerlaeia bacterium]